MFMKTAVCFEPDTLVTLPLEIVVCKLSTGGIDFWISMKHMLHFLALEVQLIISFEILEFSMKTTKISTHEICRG